MSNAIRELAKNLEQRRRDYPWEFEGLDDWSTDDIVAQLNKLGIDTAVDRFPQQAEASGAFGKLEHEWVEQIPEKTRKTTLWEDFPLMAVPVLWKRLAPHVICADLIEEHLYAVLAKEDEGERLPDVNGLPADLAAALELARFVGAAQSDQRAARFEAVNAGRAYDYSDWLPGVVAMYAPGHPDECTQIADVLSECFARSQFQGLLAAGLAVIGRMDEAMARTTENLKIFPDDYWALTLAGDVFEVKKDEEQAIAHWLAALPRSPTGREWDDLFDRIEETFALAGREAELPAILAVHPRPAGDDDEEVLPPLETDELPNDPIVSDIFGDPPVQQLTTARTAGRNAPCPCGSGKKYKKCCMT